MSWCVWYLYAWVVAQTMTMRLAWRDSDKEKMSREKKKENEIEIDTQGRKKREQEWKLKGEDALVPLKMVLTVIQHHAAHVNLYCVCVQIIMINGRVATSCFRITCLMLTVFMGCMATCSWKQCHQNAVEVENAFMQCKRAFSKENRPKDVHWKNATVKKWTSELLKNQAIRINWQRGFK